MLRLCYALPLFYSLSLLVDIANLIVSNMINRMNLEDNSGNQTVTKSSIISGKAYAEFGTQPCEEKKANLKIIALLQKLSAE